ncbi:hypothetical protein FRC06_003682 [Ceratobasidium sp. 370]|nr:hypothetical protein FRC06_003682 [Ceratobasidium sp. 370]
MATLNHADRVKLNNFARRYGAIVAGPLQRARRQSILCEALAAMHAAHPQFHDSGNLRTVVFNYMDNHRNKDRLKRSYKRRYPPSAVVSKRSTRSESAARNAMQRDASTSTKVTGGQSPKMIMEVVIEVSKVQWRRMRAAKTAGSSAARDV